MQYQQALEVATAAAREAGEILRRELHRPGGPLGTAAKAPADTEAEWAIRKRLAAAFPGFSLRGEETGFQASADPDRHCWLVDPNDGTASFHNGHRGSAVSIALLANGRPVLGVVYSFAAPDDDGDLFTWAEGCGPLQRNGKPAGDRSWPGELARLDLLLFSEGAGRRPERNAAAAAPARFRALPSIAYRLALAAAGEAAVAVSLHSPGSWDYGGGHALLLGAGGRLVNERGQEIAYTAAGESASHRCFGGAPGVVGALTGRDWDSVLRSPRPPAEEYPPAVLQPGRNVADAVLLARAQGCLLGQVAGDSLGSLVEFGPPGELAERYSAQPLLVDGGRWNTLAGQPTDDSELALMLARSIVQSRGYQAEAAARAYAYWLGSAPFDCGGTIGCALQAITRESLAAGQGAEAAGKAANQLSQANGSLMRLSPLGIWGHCLPAEQLAGHARADCQLTHPHPVCREAAAVFAVALAYAIGRGADARETYEYAMAWARSNASEPGVVDALSAAATRPPKTYTGSKAGWVLLAFQNAFYQLLHASTVQAALVETVMAGGDTDTNAAIAGALLGAVRGREAVPQQWRQMVLSCRPIAGLAGVHRPRPQPFWPVDVLELAECLLLAH